MKLLCKNPIAALLVVFVLLMGIGLVGPGVAHAVVATAPTLGAASSYAVLGFSTVTCTGATTVNGEVGVSTGAAITGFPVPCTVTPPSTTHSNDASAIAAQAAVLTAYGQLAAQPVGDALNLAVNNTVTPGIYEVGATSLSGTTLTLDGPGIYLFRSSSSIVTSGAASVVLTNGASAGDVFWQIPTTMNIGTGTVMVGTIIADTGTITLATGASLNGRALTKGTAVTLDANIITVPTSLTLNKVVTNDNGGTALASAWTLTATGTGIAPTNLSGNTPVISGATFAADTYTLAETGGPAGYLPTYSCVLNGGAPVAGNIITIAPGDDATCTITNNDIAPRLHLVKVIVGGTAALTAFPLTADGTGANDITGTSPVNSGVGLLADTWALSETNVASYTASAWVCVGGVQVGSNITLGIDDEATCTITNTYVAPGGGGGYGAVPPLISIVKVPSPLNLPGGPGSVLYTYTVSNIGTVAMDNVTAVDDSCSPLALVSGDTNSDSRLDLTETWTYTCTTTLTETHTNTVVATGWANGISATDIANATVTVGLPPIVPPLINITKVPSPLTLPATGGLVTYTKTVTNPGTVPLSNVTVTDAKCSAVSYVSGDLNSDSLLDPTESWIYRCSMNLTETTTNTAIATGQANGLTATDFAIATVVVPGVIPTPVPPVPALPDTGFAPQGIMSLFILLGILIAAFASLYIYRKKITN